VGSSSSSSTRKTTKQETTDRRVGASGSAIAAGSGGTVTITDELPAEARQAIDSAFDSLTLSGERTAETAEKVLEGSEKTTNSVIDFAERITLSGLGLAGQSTRTAGQSLAVVAERQKEDETGPQIEDFTPMILGAGGIIALAIFLAR